LSAGLPIPEFYLCLFGPKRYHLGAGLESVQVVGPGLHHSTAFDKVRCSVVGSPVWITDSMGKLMLDKVNAHLQDLIKDGSCSRS
jgi:hypothetical protein